MVEQTFAMIKPDAWGSGQVWPVLRRIQNTFTICEMRQAELTLEQAQEFYAEHKERGFFKDLCAFMASGPVVLLVLEGPDAVITWRKLLGATDPRNAIIGTIRYDFGEKHGVVWRNVAHGSDSPRHCSRSDARPSAMR